MLAPFRQKRNRYSRIITDQQTSSLHLNKFAPHEQGEAEAIVLSRHQPKNILRPVEEREQHIGRAILLLAREGAEILHHLFEEGAHRGKHGIVMRGAGPLPAGVVAKQRQLCTTEETLPA